LGPEDDEYEAQVSQVWNDQRAKGINQEHELFSFALGQLVHFRGDKIPRGPKPLSTQAGYAADKAAVAGEAKHSDV
jgi:hypothetical protein